MQCKENITFNRRLAGRMAERRPTAPPTDTIRPATGLKPHTQNSETAGTENIYGRHGKERQNARMTEAARTQRTDGNATAQKPVGYS